MPYRRFSSINLAARADSSGLRMNQAIAWFILNPLLSELALLLCGGHIDDTWLHWLALYPHKPLWTIHRATVYIKGVLQFTQSVRISLGCFKEIMLSVMLSVLAKPKKLVNTFLVDGFESVKYAS